MICNLHPSEVLYEGEGDESDDTAGISLLIKANVVEYEMGEIRGPRIEISSDEEGMRIIDEVVAEFNLNAGQRRAFSCIALEASLAACFPDIDSEAVQPFMTKTGAPNVFCFFHLVYQSLRYDFVSPSFYLAN